MIKGVGMEVGLGSPDGNVSGITFNGSDQVVILVDLRSAPR